eukprot:TRINITY_DN259_c0_g1_i4.p1 TRINITY_DN259_c0_g1~~TRINITY_DN259_c0_g1_i4.p1  ORF type:complete len:154 (-),score=38.71 TRINITY_DN259_c0_g1_i4:86-547(-)
MATGKGKMQQWLNYRMRVTIQDGRELIGQFMAFDRHMNIVLGDAEEYRPIGRKKEGLKKRPLGLVLLRGENIVSLSVEGPAPTTNNRRRFGTSLAGPGQAKVAGRGIAAPPPMAVPQTYSNPAVNYRGGPPPGGPGRGPPPGFRGPPPGWRGP